MKLSKLAFTVLLISIVSIGCNDSQDIVPLISQDSEPSLSAKEIDETTELLKEFTFMVQNDDEPEREAEYEIYQGGKIEDGKVYIILPKMRQRAVEENPEWRQIDAMAAPDLETLKARARAGQSGKKKRSEDPELAYQSCYIYSPFCNADAGIASITSQAPSYSASHLHGYHFYTYFGECLSAWSTYHGGSHTTYCPGPPSSFIETIGSVSDIWGGCHDTWASFCSGMHWC